LSGDLRSASDRFDGHSGIPFFLQELAGSLDNPAARIRGLALANL
jgi:hypothetical protein